MVVLFFTVAMIYLQLSKEIYKYIKTDKNVFCNAYLHVCCVIFNMRDYQILRQVLEVFSS